MAVPVARPVAGADETNAHSSTPRALHFDRTVTNRPSMSSEQQRTARIQNRSRTIRTEKRRVGDAHSPVCPPRLHRLSDLLTVQTSVTCSRIAGIEVNGRLLWRVRSERTDYFTRLLANVANIYRIVAAKIQRFISFPPLRLGHQYDAELTELHRPSFARRVLLTAHSQVARLEPGDRLEQSRDHWLTSRCCHRWRSPRTRFRQSPSRGGTTVRSPDAQ